MVRLRAAECDEDRGVILHYETLCVAALDEVERAWAEAVRERPLFAGPRWFVGDRGRLAEDFGVVADCALGAQGHELSLPLNWEEQYSAQLIW